MRDFATVTVGSWEELERLARPSRIYRGQASTAWPLASSLERCLESHEIKGAPRDEIEKDLCREFRRAFHHYSSHVPAHEDRLEWLSLMQHYGAPTRLVDFTYSLYVACYFAIERATGDSVIWAVDVPWALRESARRLRAAGVSASEVQLLTTRVSEDTTARLAKLLLDTNVRFACPANAFRLNERLRIQKGLFLTPGEIGGTFEDNVASLEGWDQAQCVTRIVVPRAVGRDALLRLFRMNLSRVTLFPGLGGYAESLGIFHPAFRPKDTSWYAKLEDAD